MTRQTTVKVSIHGAEFSFKTDDPEYIKQLATFVDEQIRRVEATGKIASPSKAITLAAFNIADELFRLRAQKEELEKKLAERLDAMIAMTEQQDPDI
jgi:cell division protein ZapA